MLDRCPYGSCRGGSRTLTIFKMKLFLAIVNCPVVNYSTKNTILNVTGILFPCIVHVQLTLIGTSAIIYSIIVEFGI